MSEEFHVYYRGFDRLQGNQAFNRWRDGLPDRLQAALSPARHGDIPRWLGTLMRLPKAGPVSVKSDGRVVELLLDSTENNVPGLRSLLMDMKPWRKGPFKIGDIVIDSEWRSDLKWDRIRHQISPLTDRLVLDVGCGNGYHCWRMLGAGARAVIGIDPTLLYVMQYFAIQHFARTHSVFVVPFALEDLPSDLEAFDTVFSMGVLYHRRSPLDHLLTLQSCLKPGGELVLETLVIENETEKLLMPSDRYASMKNVWFIPSCDMLRCWLIRCGFIDVRLVGVCATRDDEQRATEWSSGVSLIDFLDPVDQNKTIEGYPAPVRAIFIASK